MSWPPVPRLWPGALAVILASGPSLGRQDLAPLHAAHAAGRCRVMAVNDSWRKYSAADLLYACDDQWWVKESGAAAFAGLKVTQDALAAKRYGLMRVPSVDEPGLSLDPLRIHTGLNGGFQALNLALLLGAARILLLGYDMRLGPAGEKHWHPDHQGACFNPDPVKLAEWACRFEETPPMLATAGVAVINCTPGSAIGCFPRGELAEELACAPIS